MISPVDWCGCNHNSRRYRYDAVGTDPADAPIKVSLAFFWSNRTCRRTSFSSERYTSIFMSTKCPARSLRTDGRRFLIADARRFGSELDQVFCPCLADPRSDFSRGCHQGSVSLPCLGLSMFRLNSHTSFCSFNITSIDLNFIPTAHSYPLAKGKLSSGSSRFISSSIDWCR